MSARNRAIAALQRLAGAPDAVWAAPGRVNLIGEHVDYHAGLVCPIAIGCLTVTAVRRRSDRTIRVVSTERDDAGTIDLDRVRSPRRAWFDYVEGVVRAMQSAGHPITGADIAVASDVPIGVGLSSSAALEVSVAAALAEASGITIDRRQLALAGRWAENQFVGVRSGIMDQLVVALAVAGCAVEIDCRSEDVRLVPVPPGATFVVADSGVRHALAASPYNERREQSEAAAHAIGLPLRDADLGALEPARLPDVLQRRARHVITEITRVEEFVDALERGDLASAGRAMTASHHSLRDDYEVSVPELDALVDAALEIFGVYGARMTGGGFGGSIVALVDAGSQRNAIETLARRGISVMPVSAGPGVRSVL